MKSEPQIPINEEKVLQEGDLAQTDSMHAPDGAKLAEEDIKQGKPDPGESKLKSNFKDYFFP